MSVIGTAGHVDHGKTLLVQALTGEDTDRLPEEKRRGLTIDLGFASFPGRDGAPVGVVDVPGHERFIRNMIAGAWGVDCGLLVVAADEGWAPQTTDHTLVLGCVGVRRLVLAVTKADRVAEPEAQRVRQDAVLRCASLGFEDPPSLIVSATTGQGISELRTALLDILVAPVDENADRGESATACLFVDRAFPVSGAGTVVTGTLRGGPVSAGAELMLQPAEVRVRVRGIQHHGREVASAQPCSRVALNLQGIAADAIQRGDCLTDPGSQMSPTQELILWLVPRVKLRVRGEVEIALGTGHRIGALHLLGPPGSGEVPARLTVQSPLPVAPGQRVALMRQGGTQLVACGRVCWCGELDRERRRRVATLLLADPGSRLSRARLQIQLDGMISAGTAADLTAVGGLPVVQRDPWLFHADTLARAEREIGALAGRPGGVSEAELASSLDFAPDATRAITASLLLGGALSRSGSVLVSGRPGAATRLPARAQGVHDQLARAAAAGLQVRRLSTNATADLRALVRLGLAVSLDRDIHLSTEVYRDLADRILAGRPIGKSFTIAEARAASGLSRKYLIPLLGRMQIDGWVQRTGDTRTVRALPTKPL